MKPINWISEKIISSVASLIGGLIISKAESETLKHQLNTLNDLEEAAREYEADGKLQLAQLLRDKISVLSTSSTGHISGQIAGDLQSNQIHFLDSRPTDSAAPKLTANVEPEKRKRGRPKKANSSKVCESEN